MRDVELYTPGFIYWLHLSSCKHPMPGSPSITYQEWFAGAGEA